MTRVTATRSPFLHKKKEPSMLARGIEDEGDSLLTFGQPPPFGFFRQPAFCEQAQRAHPASHGASADSLTKAARPANSTLASRLLGLKTRYQRLHLLTVPDRACPALWTCGLLQCT